MNSLTKDEKKVIREMLIDFINSRCSMKQFEEFIDNNFCKICKKNELNRFFDIANDFYMNDDDYKKFKDYFLSNNLNKYVIDNYKKLLFVNDDSNCMYHVNIDKKDIMYETFVKNGTLIFEIHRIIDYNIDTKKRLMLIDKLDKYLKEVENKLATILYVEVKILYNDTIIPSEN